MFCLLLAALFPLSFAHERGAPCSALLDISMTPQHGARPQPSPSPFRLAVLNDGSSGELVDAEVVVGQRYKIIIDHGPDVAIKGFIIRALFEDPKRPDAGEFVDLPDCVRLVKWCSVGGNYVTHRQPGGKPGGCPSGPLLLRWQAPKDKVEDLRIYFQATVVEDYKTFWTDIVTPSYQLIGKETTTPKPVPTFALKDTPPSRELLTFPTNQVLDFLRPAIDFRQSMVETLVPSLPDGSPNLAWLRPPSRRRFSAQITARPPEPRTRPPTRPRVTTAPTFPPTTTLKPITPPDFDPSCGIEDGPDCLDRLRVDFKRSFCEIEGWPDYCPQLCCYKVKGEPSPFA